MDSRGSGGATRTGQEYSSVHSILSITRYQFFSPHEAHPGQASALVGLVAATFSKLSPVLACGYRGQLTAPKPPLHSRFIVTAQLSFIQHMASQQDATIIQNTTRTASVISQSHHSPHHQRVFAHMRSTMYGYLRLPHEQRFKNRVVGNVFEPTELA
jgi:hypothetical protein